MKGRRQFSSEEIATISAILLERPRTKQTRDKLRDLGFYITKFNNPSVPFTVADLDRLIAAGEIEVSEHAWPPVPPSIKQPNARLPQVVDGGDAEDAHQRYRPEIVRHLMIGESAPNGGTFFYHANSLLFRHTHRAFQTAYGSACGEGEAFLDFFRDHGFFLDDLCAVPVNHMDDAQRAHERSLGIGPLAARIKIAKPQTVIVVMKAIATHIRAACELAKIAPDFLTLPFPSRPNHQQQFVNGLANFLMRLEK